MIFTCRLFNSILVCIEKKDKLTSNRGKKLKMLTGTPHALKRWYGGCPLWLKEIRIKEGERSECEKFSTIFALLLLKNGLSMLLLAKYALLSQNSFKHLWFYLTLAFYWQKSGTASAVPTVPDAASLRKLLNKKNQSNRSKSSIPFPMKILFDPRFWKYRVSIEYYLFHKTISAN